MRGARPPSSRRGNGAAALASVTRAGLLPGGDDRLFRRFVDNFVRLSGRMQLVRAALAKAMGLSPPQYNIVMILARAEAREGEPMGAIARRLGVSISFIVAEARALEKLGLVALARNPTDRRSVLVSLAPAGRARLRRAMPRIRRINDMLFAKLSRAELVAMDRAIGRILADSDAALAALGRASGEKG